MFALSTQWGRQASLRERLLRSGSTSLATWRVSRLTTPIQRHFSLSKPPLPGLSCRPVRSPTEFSGTGRVSFPIARPLVPSSSPVR